MRNEEMVTIILRAEPWVIYWQNIDRQSRRAVIFFFFYNIRVTRTQGNMSSNIAKVIHEPQKK